MSNFRKQHMKIKWNNLINVESDEIAKNASLAEKSALVGRVGLIMLSVGAGAFRVRAAMNKISRSLDITCQADIGLLSINYTCIYKSQALTNSLSISTTGVNTDRLYHIRYFIDEFEQNSTKYSIKHFFKI